jgi:hypothetical protein
MTVINGYPVTLFYEQCPIVPPLCVYEIAGMFPSCIVQGVSMTSTIFFAALAVIFSLPYAAQASSFNYHGNLQDAGKPAEGKYDIELTLYSAAQGGKVMAGPLTIEKVVVSQGTFTTQADFGPLLKSATQTWLGVKVRPAGEGDFAALSTRMVIAPDTNTSCPGSWSLDGNAGNPAGSYLGTTDTVLVLRAQGQQVVTSGLSSGSTVPFWIGGGSYNGSVGGKGAFIGGGGSNTSIAAGNQVGKFCVIGGGDTNTAFGTVAEISGGATGYATIGGGQGNKASGYAATIAGGGGFTDDGMGNQVVEGNSANGSASAIGGGQGNTASGLWSTVSGGSGNSASGEGAMISGGEQNAASANGAAVAGGFFNTASAVGSFTAGGVKNVAAGAESFAAGYYAQANHNGSFVWADNTASTPFATTAVNQFMVRASGGVGINGAPKNNGIELSLYPNAGGPNYSNLFYGVTGKNAGILTSAGDATSTNNNASFYFDQFDGSSQVRKLTISTNGLTVNDESVIPGSVSTGLIALNLVHSPLTNNALINMYPGTNDASFYELNAGANGGFQILRYIPNVSVSVPLDIAANGDITVLGNAFKPGGGSWSVSSDRRIKERVEPIDDALATILKLRPVNFHYTAAYRAQEGGLADQGYAGFVAQEYAEVFPEAVTATQKRVPGSAASDPAMLALDPNPALITTVAAVQELALENAALHKQLKQLAARLEKLEARRGE